MSELEAALYMNVRTWVKRSPSFAILSNSGVCVVGWPYTPRSPEPRSSAKRMRTAMEAP